MAAADLLVIIAEVILRQIHSYYFPVNFLDFTAVCILRRLLRRVSTDCSVWFTVAFTFDRYIAICCQKLKTKYCTRQTAAAVLAIIGVLFCLKSIPFAFTFQAGQIIDGVLWFCYLKPSFFTEPGWVGLDSFDRILTPLLPFVVILLLNALTVRHILVTSRVRKELRGQCKGENCSDPEMESRRRSMVLLLTLSGSFILLWLTDVVGYSYYLITGYEFNDYEYLVHEVGSLLKNLSCCTNTIIYAVTQSKFREQMISALKYPVTSLIRFINKVVA
ncbi:probable G-protein coupled receptor 139 [Leucoraja erinacea]|uniref:probable G-protein coupled receptor 139 n=1 Tax=Leucoraja erinaceus TaxID=7782 RepID=UPI002458B32D|nr:probable G-protein coupled receptor 139 [Leucoraja erinacea]